MNADQSHSVSSKGRYVGMYNGKKMYEVTVTGNMPKFVSAGSLQGINIAHGVPNINTVIGVVSAKYGNWNDPYFESGTVKTCIGIINKTTISFLNMAAWGSNYDWIVTFRYI